jgi:hypothetical protein
MTDERALWIVDRIEGERVVLVEDATDRTAEVGRSGIGVTVREGAALRVPVLTSGKLDWLGAQRDEAEEEARRDEARRILDDLRRRDPGGDVDL